MKCILLLSSSLWTKHEHVHIFNYFLFFLSTSSTLIFSPVHKFFLSHFMFDFICSFTFFLIILVCTRFEFFFSVSVKNIFFPFPIYSFPYFLLFTFPCTFLFFFSTLFLIIWASCHSAIIRPTHEKLEIFMIKRSILSQCVNKSEAGSLIWAEWRPSFCNLGYNSVLKIPLLVQKSGYNCLSHLVQFW